jgi:hypothetical protein
MLQRRLTLLSLMMVGLTLTACQGQMATPNAASRSVAAQAIIPPDELKPKPGCREVGSEAILPPWEKPPATQPKPCPCRPVSGQAALPPGYNKPGC